MNDTAGREGLMAFCHTVFGWEFEVGGPETAYYSIAQINGVPVAGIGQMEGSVAQWTTYLATKDLDATVVKAKELGANVFFEPIDVMEQGRLALMMDPTNAVVGLWEQKNFAGSGVYGEPNAPFWHNHSSTDPKRAAEFYRDLFGVTVIENDGMYSLSEGADEPAYASVSPNPNPDDMPAHWAPILLTESLAVTRERVTGAGGTLMFESMAVPGGDITAFQDPVVGSFMTVFAPTP